jgi:hypothetical protein
MNLTPLFNLSGPAGGGGGGRVLPFKMQDQEQLLWCWAATSVSVNLYFDAASSQRQCSLVNTALRQTTCCGNGASRACNKAWFLDKALTIVGNLDQMTAGHPSLAEVEAEIDAGRPLCLRIQWDAYSAHFVAIYGYSGTMINVDDPWTGRASVEYDKFPTLYQTGGTWTHTYWVRN